LDQLSCWGDVTTENEQQVIASNLKFHPQRIKLLEMLSEILCSNNIEYWIDQGTLLGANRNGKIIKRDCDVDIALANEEQFVILPKIFDTNLPAEYDWYRKGSQCTGFNVYLKDGGICEGEFNGRKYSWKQISCDIAFYAFKEIEQVFFYDYKWFSVNKFLFPKEVIFPLRNIEFEGKQHPCPNQIEEYLKIQYGYIGDNAVYDATTDRYIEKR